MPAPEHRAGIFHIGLRSNPARYGNSGVMTFLVNQDGVVFQKDLGERTAEIAQSMTAFNPDHTWAKAAIDLQP